ncbi:MAG: ATP-binding protein [Candidatus Peribacter sp.]|jgi:hypothetical protein|nr:ATP-binding protein [Candidatus Peribacter sp.]MBT4392981.1 ATP-binding protein [Candidatus Peribacter sp.]MBT4601041.1 ATP-binding protein [Candidatus Peribacter sp.]MBT5149597.1 ATP-binding protein [Candidatus Peribacter sp.]MBT5637471.1 ATP-binding protein [Candidatus Peribacter sp.]
MTNLVTVLEAEIVVDDPGAIENDNMYYREIGERLVQIRHYLVSAIAKTERFGSHDMLVMKIGLPIEEGAINCVYHGNLERSSAIRDDEQTRSAMIEDLKTSHNPEMHTRSVRVQLQFVCDGMVDQPELRPSHIKTVIEDDEDPNIGEEIDSFPIQITQEGTLDHSAIQEVIVTLQDEGKGFEEDKVVDPTDPDYIERNHGRGLLLMRAFMDRVEYSDGGRLVALSKIAELHENS